MKHYRWAVQTPDPDKVRALADAINVSEPIARALCNRGIFTYDDAKAFFRPTLATFHPPLAMKGMDIAAARISKAIDNRERIMIYGDYDVDGTTGTSLLLMALRDMGASVDFYINDRQREGYGVALSGVQHAKETGVTLIISVDCGITAFEPVEYCNAHSIDFIICDHHESKHDMPNALAVLDPKQADCAYPFKELSGCGVAFKLIQAVSQLRGLDNDFACKYLDFVALAVAADIVPVIGENRTLLAEGIKRFQTNPRLSLRALADAAAVNLTKTSTTSLVFSLSPRINAAGRLDHARHVVELLTTSDDSKAKDVAELLERLNAERREIDRAMFLEAEEAARALTSIYPSSIVLYHPEWHLGVVGIVASRVVEKFYLPTVILTDSNGVLKGSVRSVAGLNVYQALSMCASHLVQFGGHDMAAGLSLKIEQLEAFRSAFEKTCSDLMSYDMRIPELQIDAEIELEQINEKFFSVLQQFEPCGPKNMHPLFLTRGLKPLYPPQLLKEQHLKFFVQDKLGRRFDAIGFGMPDRFAAIQNTTRSVSIVYSIDENEWNNEKKLQLRLRDVKVD